MDDELVIDASGCWVRKNPPVIIETPLRSRVKHYKSLAYPADAKYPADDKKQDEISII